MTDKPKIAVIEDDPQARELLLVLLRDAGMEPKGAEDGVGGLEMVRTWSPDLLLLDHTLPGPLKGLDVCREIRQAPETANLPVIVLTAEISDQFEERFFEAGADDYIRKSMFKANLLIKRIGAVLRRTRQVGSDVIETDHLTIHPGRREVLVEGESVNLTPTEFDILFKLAQNRDRALSRRELLDRGGADGEGVDRTVDVHVLSIRRKLGKRAWLISTVWGRGYRLGTAPGN